MYKFARLLLTLVIASFLISATAKASDFYEVLQVRRDASENEVKTAFHNLVKLYHPDLRGGDRSKESDLAAVKAAYATLGDPAKRAEYDRKALEKAFDFSTPHGKILKPDMPSGLNAFQQMLWMQNAEASLDVIQPEAWSFGNSPISTKYSYGMQLREEVGVETVARTIAAHLIEVIVRSMPKVRKEFSVFEVWAKFADNLTRGARVKFDRTKYYGDSYTVVLSPTEYAVIDSRKMAKAMLLGEYLALSEFAKFNPIKAAAYARANDYKLESLVTSHQAKRSASKNETELALAETYERSMRLSADLVKKWQELELTPAAVHLKSRDVVRAITDGRNLKAPSCESLF